ncbi:hypothetical protein MuYL_2156 [Mucilaginibacter xinganensis]|uniref:Uncharacterized protein n=1 Tax=Mucilaginibacter xinganensis TaxID=1234841 RepID=A0A223NW39_9SPHI|nr:hypothetical protein MuYL_2156 [Mucilaginibacter xinganensis]
MTDGFGLISRIAEIIYEEGQSIKIPYQPKNKKNNRAPPGVIINRSMN